MDNFKKNVVIIDYQLGNLFSVKQACDTVGINARISSEREDILKADALILPGVGAFIEAMNNLKKLGLDTAIKEKVNNRTPLFGICLGQQLLFTESEEFGAGNGLDLIHGIIKKFPEKLEDRKIKVPHIAWNTIYKSTQDWVQNGCKTASIGCIECKGPVIEGVLKELQPIQERAAQYAEDPTLVKNIVAEGCEKARKLARETMRDVRDVMGLNYG